MNRKAIGKNLQIEGVRGIAILLVVVYHLFYRYSVLFGGENIQETGILQYFGSIGVDLFLLITSLYTPNIEKETNGRVWLVDRIKKIYPMYFLSVICIFLFMHIAPLPGRSVSIVDLGLNIVLLNGFVGKPYVDGAHWYITTLISCLVITSAIVRLTNRKRMIAYFIWCLLGIVLYSLKFINNHIISKVASGIYHVIAGDYTYVFVFGVTVKAILDGYKGKETILLILSCIGGLIYVETSVVNCVILFMCACLLSVAYKQKMKILEVPLFVKVGSISYCIYLFHQNIGYSVVYYLSVFFKKDVITFRILSFVFVLFLGWVIQKLIGNRFTKIMRGTKIK